MFPASIEPVTSTVPAAWPTGMAHLGIALTGAEHAEAPAAGGGQIAHLPCRRDGAAEFRPPATGFRTPTRKARD